MDFLIYSLRNTSYSWSKFILKLASKNNLGRYIINLYIVQFHFFLKSLPSIVHYSQISISLKTLRFLSTWLFMVPFNHVKNLSKVWLVLGGLGNFGCFCLVVSDFGWLGVVFGEFDWLRVLQLTFPIRIWFFPD